MTYQQAIETIENNSHLIGKKVKGKIVDEIIIYPTDNNSKKEFKRIYLSTLDSKKAIEPFKNEDVDVSAIIDKRNIRAGFFISSNLDDVEKELEN